MSNALFRHRWAGFTCMRQGRSFWRAVYTRPTSWCVHTRVWRTFPNPENITLVSDLNTDTVTQIHRQIHRQTLYKSRQTHTHIHTETTDGISTERNEGRNSSHTSQQSQHPCANLSLSGNVLLCWFLKTRCKGTTIKIHTHKVILVNMSMFM